MHIKMRCVLCCLAFFASNAALGADLLSIYRQAREQDPALDAMRFSHEAVQQKVLVARAGFLPSLGFSANQGRTHAESAFTNVPKTARPVDAWNWNLQLTQPILRMQNVYAYQQSTAQEEASEAQLAAVDQELILRVAEAYFAILVAENAVDTIDAQMRAMAAQLAQATHGYKSGVRAVTDVHEASAKVEEAKAQKIAAEHELSTKQSELEKIIGTPPPPLAGLGTTRVLPAPNPLNVEQWIEKARVQNPQVRMQELLVHAAEAEIARNRAEHLPTLELTAGKSRGYSSGSPGTPNDYYSRSNNAQIGMQLSIPIFSGGATSARVSEARANRGRINAQLEEVRRKVVAETRQAYTAILSSLARIKALEAAVNAGESAVKGNLVGYQMGLRINSDVLMAEQQLYQSRHEWVKARYDALLQGLRLKAAAGLLAEETLIEINPQLSAK